MLIQLDNVTFGYDGVPVLRNVCFALNENERVGFIGGNGEGKTTLIKLALGQLSPDEGSVFVKNSARIGYLEQSGGFESALTVYEAMKEVFAQDIELIEALRETERRMAGADEKELHALSSKCDSLNARIAARDSYNFDVRIRTVLNGMGFDKVYEQKISTMSGGEKTRLKLCRLLLEEPDLLILDEPTNHLDVKTLFWLEDYLSAYKGSLFIVSHDRYFLDRLTSRTLELERGEVTAYKGNYSKYKVLKAERVLNMQREYEKQQEEIAHLQDYVDRNLVRATTAKSAQSRVKQLQKMERLEKPLPPPKPPRFCFSYSEQPYERVLAAEGFDLKAEDKVLLHNASFTLLRGEKCALTGDNGTGKSTLLKFFLSRNPQVKLGKFVKIAYYDQENADLDPEENVLSAFWGKNSLLSQTDARKILAQSGLGADDVQKKVKELSGGLRAKLELSLLQAKRGNVLFLDEPTNHLDLPAREALEEALTAFDGTLLFVSHDRRFIEAVATKIALIENRSLSVFDGNYLQFLEQSKLAEKQTAPPARKAEAEKGQNGGFRSKEERAREAQKRNRTKEIETRLADVERKTEELNALIAENAADYKKVAELNGQLNALRAEEDLLYAEYETLI